MPRIESGDSKHFLINNDFMFYRPWRIWLLFALCLAIILPAMIGLTIKAIQLEESRRIVMQQNDQARREAELQELVSSALWRLDWMLTPLVGQEASRSYLDYQPYSPLADKNADPSDLKVWSDNVSPIIVQPSEFVLLHFEVSPENKWTSPQNPTGQIRTLALGNGIAPANMSKSYELLQQLSGTIDNSDLEQLLPEQLLPELDLGGNLEQEMALLQGNTLQQQNPDPIYLSNNISLPNANDEEQANAPAPQSQNAANPAQSGEQSQNSSPEAYSQLTQRGQRIANDFQQRANVSQSLAQTYLELNSGKVKKAKTKTIVREGVSRPLWVEDKLLLARRTIQGDKTVLQGCWFNWPKLQETLIAQIADLLPGARLVPVKDGAAAQPGRLLATLPIQLDVSQVNLNLVLASSNNANPLAVDNSIGSQRFSPIRVSLIIAWSCMLLGTIAVAILLQGVVKLSERRASFVSAVTHELRTPLTTFRMYAEMLAKGMVKTPEKQQQYCETLQVEADRLSHLVENVLQFARLEHGKKVNAGEELAVAELIDRYRIRFSERVAQAGMTLSMIADEHTQAAVLKTDTAAIEHILFNLIDNACKYACQAKDNQITLAISKTASSVEFRVQDHGPGIADSQKKRVFQPFSKSAQDAAKSAPGVGLGLALCQRLATQLGGKLQIEKSSQTAGTTFLLSLPRCVNADN